MIGKKPSEIFPDGRFSRADEVVARIVASGKPEFLRQTVPIGNGEIGIHDISFVPEFYESGRVVSVLGIGRDMTDIYRMQEAVAVREQEFRSLAESSPDFIIRTDHNGCIRYLNAALLNLLGVNNAKEMVGRRASEVWPDGRFDKIAQAEAQSVESASTRVIELTVPNDAGGFEYHQIYVVPERDVAGTIIGTIAFGRNVTSIRESELRLKYFINSLPGFAFTFKLAPDGHLSFPYASPAIYDFYGLQPEDVRDDAAPLHALAHPEDQPRILAAIFEAERTMRLFCIEFRVCRPGLPERWLEVNSVPDIQGDGSILWYGIMLDITERMLMKQQLHLKEFVLDHAHEAVYLMNRADFSFVYVNEEACRALRYSREELMGLSLKEIDPDLTPEAGKALWGKVLANGSYAFETRHRRRDGSIFPVEINGSMVEYEGRTLSLSLVRDITERQAAEAALHASEERMRLFFERQLVGMAITSPEKGWLEVNDKLCEMLGYTREELARLTWAEVTYPADLATDEGCFERLLGGEIDSYTLEKRFVRKDGDIVFSAIAVGCVRRADKSVEYLLALLEDITERKQAESDLDDSRAQLRGLIAQREAAREEERKHIAREVHDNLGQILSGLRLNVSRFSRLYAANSAEMQQQLQETGKLIELAVNEVRNISAALRPVEREMDIRSALACHLDRFSAYTGIACKLHAENDVPLLGEDHSLALFRIAQEALTNVARHALADSVAVNLSMEPLYCVLSICDNGIGFDTKIRKLNSFGLVGIRERVAMLGGSVVVESHPGQGTEITVHIQMRNS